MKNIITVIVLTNIFSHNIACMKRPGTDLEKQLSVKKVKGDEEISSPFLPIDIWGSILMDPFNNNVMESPQSLQTKIQTICLISREFHQYISKPDIIRTIIGNASRYASHLRGIYVSHIKMPAVQNYVQKSQTLHSNIDKLTENEMRALIQNGADINYCNFVCNLGRIYYTDLYYTAHIDQLTNIYPPILFKTQNDYNKSKLLLDLGASPTIHFLDLKGNFHNQEIVTNNLDTLSPLEDAQRQGNIELVKLYSQYLDSNDDT